MFLIIDPDKFPQLDASVNQLHEIEAVLPSKVVRKADLIAVKEGQGHFKVLKNRFDRTPMSVDQDRLDDYLQSFTSQLTGRG